jgi:hypothetical protein
MSLQSAKVKKALIGLLFSVAAGLLIAAIPQVLVKFGLENPLYLVALSLILVAFVLFYYFFSAKQPPLIWWVGSSVTLLVGIILLFKIIVTVPNAVDSPITDASALIFKEGLVPLDIEMAKGGSDRVVSQFPEPGTRRFKNSVVKLFYGQHPSLSITQPTNGEVVSMEYTIRGTSIGVSGSKGLFIRVLVRTRDNQVWIQGEPIVQADGSFEGNVQFGEEDKGRGEDYSIMAIAAKEPLKEGDQGIQIPEYVAISSVIAVTRER